MLSQVPWNSTDTLELRRSKTAALHQHVTLPHKLPPTGEAMWSWQLFHYCQLPLLQFFYYIHALSFLNARWMLTIRFFFFRSCRIPFQCFCSSAHHGWSCIEVQREGKRPFCHTRMRTLHTFSQCTTCTHQTAATVSILWEHPQHHLVTHLVT